MRNFLFYLSKKKLDQQFSRSLEELSQGSDEVEFSHPKIEDYRWIFERKKLYQYYQSRHRGAQLFWANNKEISNTFNCDELLFTSLIRP